MEDFREFAKIPRLSRECVITEKLDGTNAQVCIELAQDPDNILVPGEPTIDGTLLVRGGNGAIYWFRAGSRNRWITPEKDNYGFAEWAYAHAGELVDGLGDGTHYGEWWGAGIQRKYNIPEKRFSLFNTARWAERCPECCSVVPVLYTGMFTTQAVEDAVERLRKEGSVAAPSFMSPEGVVVFHVAGNLLFKKTLVNDEAPKGMHLEVENPI